MELTLNDIIHLYWGKVEIKIKEKDWNYWALIQEWNDFDDDQYNERVEIKPFLRPLSDMTGEEAIEFFNLPEGTEILKINKQSTFIEFDYRFKHDNPKLNIEDGFSYSGVAIGYDPNRMRESPSRMLYLISKGFDLFGLIDSGRAINKII